MAICNRCLSTLPTPDSPCPSCQSVGFSATADSLNASPESGNSVRRTLVQPLAGSVELPDLPGSASQIRRTLAEPVIVRTPGPTPKNHLDRRGRSAGPSSIVSAATVGSAANRSPPAPSSRETPPQIYRPYRRPPTPILIAIDEGVQVEGEILRVRDEAFLIGRTEGDFQIPNDPDISGKHLELSVNERGGERVWTLRDLESTNGTFVRVHQAVLVKDKEVLLGYGRYRVEIDSASSVGSNGLPDESPQDIRSTRVYTPTSAAKGVAESLRLVDVADASRMLRFADSGGILGRDPSLGELSVDDPALNARHARIAKTKNRWRIEDLSTTNGCWLRVNQLRITQDMEFQIGEQRFRFLPNGYRTDASTGESANDRSENRSKNPSRTKPL